jgi:topoisomerase-4 subunit B
MAIKVRSSRIPCFSLPKGTRPAALLPRRATRIHRPYSASGGKPLNCYGLTKKIVYENEEFNLLQHALNIEDALEDLRYGNVVIATDADVDGMHIRLLILTFFLQFFPDLVRNGHVKILETRCFVYAISRKRYTAIMKMKSKQPSQSSKINARITRFKGLGEISPEEFEGFINADIRLNPVIIKDDKDIKTILD